MHAPYMSRLSELVQATAVKKLLLDLKIDRITQTGLNALMHDHYARSDTMQESTKCRRRRHPPPLRARCLTLTWRRPRRKPGALASTCKSRLIRFVN